MKQKLRSFVACLLCFFQCVMLFSSDILAATSEGGDISSSFKIGITSCTIKVVDRYYDDNGNFEYENIRQEDTYDYGDWYDYYALDPVPDGYVYVEDYDRFLYGEADSDGYKEYNTSGEADGDREVIFSYQKEPGCTITVKDKYVDRFGTEIRTDIRCTENKYLGEGYSYDCTSYDSNEYTVVGGHYNEYGDLITSQSGTVAGDLEIIFTYQKIAEAYVTVSYSEVLCDYLNEHNSGGNHTYSPDEEIDKFKVVLGKGYWDNDFEINLEDLRNIDSDANISSFRTYYYTDGGWSSDYYYLGFPLDGAVSRDPYLFLTRYDEDYNYSDIFQYCIQFYLNLHFPLDLPVEPDTDVCCHIVLDIDGFNTIETVQLGGVYRTVIESLDADARHDSWYKFKNPIGAGNGINLAIGKYEEVQKNPDKFEFVEDGTVLMRWDDEDEEGEPIYDYDDRVAIRGRDKSNNIIFVNRDGTAFKVMAAPEIEDYTCTNPDSPREFECIVGWDDSAYCFYYDYIYTPSFRITVKDKFIDESGNEIEIQERQTDKVPEGEEYTYEALDPIPDGYKLVSDSTVTDTSTEDTEIVFVYQRIPQYIITVKDKFIDESGVEERTDTRKEDKVPEGEEYTYEALDPIPDGYKLVSDSIVTDTSTEDKEIIFIYQKIPQYTIKVKDKFIDESGVEERTDIRKEDKIPEDEKYTYKALDPIPDGYKLVSDPTVTDTSTEDKEIVFIYQKIPSYTITVKDVFTNEAGVEENTAIRQEDRLYEGSSYHYSALSPVPEGYELVGSSDYAGQADSDIEIIFTYRKKIVLPNTYSMVVKDKYIDIDGSVIRIDERVNTALKAFEEYSFTAIDPVPEGYEVVGALVYGGRITSDTEIIFVYQKKPAEKPATYSFKVVDEFYDADGNVIKTVERTTDTLEEGSEYVCTALKPVPDDYVLISDSEYRGIISEDTVIVFKYKDASVRLVTVKGYLTYKNGEPVANKKVEIHSEVRTAITDADGYYEIRNIEAGNHKYTVFNDDGTDLITCNLNITKSGQDTAEVTYKMSDVEVSIDLSVADVLEIDGVLSLYNLKVFDKFYDENNRMTKSELRESLTAVKAGTAYSYDALSPKGYSITSEKNYSGVVTGDTEVIFTYKKDKKPDKPTPSPKPDPKPDKPSPEKKSYTVTVVDNYYDSNALLISSSVRITEIKTEGDAYYYDAKPIPNFTLIGADHYSSFVYSDITLAFAYKAVATPKDAVITVIDRFIDEDGNPEDEIRITDDKKVGDPYQYDAIPKEGYEIVGSSSYTGVVTSHLTLIFTYQKISEDKQAANEYTVTVIDKFITDIPVNNFIIDESEKTGVFDGLNNFNTYCYARENGQYIYMVRREVRCKDVYTEGSSYKYNALELRNFNCISETEYSGVVNDNIELEFVYARKGLTIQDIPDNVYTSKPDYPDASEAKTGDLDEADSKADKVPYVVVIILLMVIIVAAFIGRRKLYK